MVLLFITAAIFSPGYRDSDNENSSEELRQRSHLQTQSDLQLRYRRATGAGNIDVPRGGYDGVDTGGSSWDDDGMKPDRGRDAR